MLPVKVAVQPMLMHESTRMAVCRNKCKFNFRPAGTLLEELKEVQNRAARFIFRNYKTGKNDSDL